MRKLESMYGPCVLAEMEKHEYFLPSKYSKTMLREFYDSEDPSKAKYSEADFIHTKGFYFVFKGYTKTKHFEFPILEFGRDGATCGSETESENEAEEFPNSQKRMLYCDTDSQLLD